MSGPLTAEDLDLLESIAAQKPNVWTLAFVGGYVKRLVAEVRQHRARLAELETPADPMLESTGQTPKGGAK